MSAAAGLVAVRSAPTARARGAEESCWLTAVSVGDTDALRHLWSRYRMPCLRLAHRVLGGGAHSEDVVQLVFLDVWRHAGRYDPTRATAGSWILSMTHHKAVDRVRYEQRRSTLTLELELPDDMAAAAVDDVAVDVVQRQLVRQALASLSPPQRQVLMLAHFGGFTYAEIGALLHVPLGTIKTRGRAGLQNLQARLTELGEAG